MTQTTNVKLFAIKLFDLPSERIISAKRAQLELHDRYMKLIYNFQSEVARDDDRLNWEPKKVIQHSTYRRTSLCGVHLYWGNDSNSWKLEFDFTSSGGSVVISFETQAEAIPVYEACLEYMNQTA